MISDIRLSDIIAPSFYGVHRAIKNYEYIHYMLEGGRGSAKSSFAGTELVLSIIRDPNIHGLVMRKVADTLRTSVYPQLLWSIERLGLSDKFKATVSPLEITYRATGQKIFFRGADEPSKIKSIKVKFGYIGVALYEELDQFSGAAEIRNLNQSIIRGGDRFTILYTFNPPKSRDNWVNVDKLEDKPKRLVHHSTYKTVPQEWLGQVFIDEAEALAISNPAAYEHEYEGVATGTGGQVFENIVERIIMDDEIKTMGTFYQGIDFGFAVDPFAWLAMSYNAKYKRLHIIDEIYQPKLSNSRAVEHIKAKKYYSPINADSAEPKSIEQMRELGLNIYGAKKGADSVDHGIKWLQDLNEIIIDKRRTPNAYREFTLYEYQTTKSGEYISAYPDKNNHTIDAVRYALYNIIQAKTVTAYNIQTF